MKLPFMLAALPAAAALQLPSGFTDTKIAGGLNPTMMMFAPDGRLFVNEKDGKVRIIKNDSLLPKPFATVETDSYNERGLLGIDFDPDFARNHFVYVYYTTKSVPQHNRVSRFTANGDVAEGGETVIFDLTNLSDAGNHNGGAIRFGKDGKLYIAAGNNANNGYSQSLANVLGKMLRINADGTLPADNPFYATTTGTSRAIYALGFRNPFTFGIQPGTGAIFVNDVGQNDVEEIDRLEPGTNMGWPNTEGNVGKPPAGPGTYQPPVLTYLHENGNCAIAGGAFLNPDRTTFPAGYLGRYFFADFCGGWIKSWDPAGKKDAEVFATGIAAPINIQAGPDGRLYYLARGKSTPGAAANTGSTTGEVHAIRGPGAPLDLQGSPGPKWGYLLTGPAGAAKLAWPGWATRAEIFDLTGRSVAGIRRGEQDGRALPLPASGALFRVRYLP